jgi:hypothetical protein
MLGSCQFSKSDKTSAHLGSTLIRFYRNEFYRNEFYRNEFYRNEFNSDNFRNE